MSKLFDAYKEKIESAVVDGEIKSLMIGISNDCSDYKLSWEDFLTLRKLLIKRGKKVGNKWIKECF